VLGFGAAWLMERGVRRWLRGVTTRANRPVLRAQWVTSGWLAFSHGANDAQKAVGVLAVLLLANGTLRSLSVPVWATLTCAGALTVGTALVDGGSSRPLGAESSVSAPSTVWSARPARRR
jgi:PiT family inorganic phosphate transporter